MRRETYQLSNVSAFSRCALILGWWGVRFSTVWRKWCRDLFIIGRLSSFIFTSYLVWCFFGCNKISLLFLGAGTQHCILAYVLQLFLFLHCPTFGSIQKVGPTVVLQKISFQLRWHLMISQDSFSFSHFVHIDPICYLQLKPSFVLQLTLDIEIYHTWY